MGGACQFVKRNTLRGDEGDCTIDPPHGLT